MTNLRLRASQAFDAEFRDRLANAVQRTVLMATPRWPDRIAMLEASNFVWVSTRRCRSFDAALGRAADDNTPEAALGLLYRERLVKRG